MDPITAAAVIGGGASLLGGILGNQSNAAMTASANEAAARNTAAANATSLQSAREQMAYQERMSNSAYQRAMEDMRKSGLNPMLAFSQGGASSPNGASIQAQNAPVLKAEYKDPLSPAINSAVDTYAKGKTLEQARMGLGIQQGQLGIAQANSTADIALKSAQTAATVSSAKKTETESKILESRAKREKLEGDWYSTDHGKTLWQLNRINEAVGGSLDSLNSAKDLVNPFNFLKQLKKSGPRGTGTLRDGTQFKLDTGEILKP
ncbi:VP2 [Kummerowia striata gokushovirus]|nr:VP2 [Kummerowia striata gokushovirus]